MYKDKIEMSCENKNGILKHKIYFINVYEVSDAPTLGEKKKMNQKRFELIVKAFSLVLISLITFRILIYLKNLR